MTARGNSLQQTVTVEAECTGVTGRRASFHVKAHDGIEVIGEGRHERMIVPWARFVARVNEKAKAAVRRFKQEIA